MTAAPLVSIVTPFYNTREFLAECIESVLRQTYQNWEYVLVDNCSTDGSYEIAAKASRIFPNKIRLIRSEVLRAQVPNYNFALCQISSESKYCKMVQADDWIYPVCVERMVELAERDPTIGIVSSYREKGGRIVGRGLPTNRTRMSGPEICRLQLSQPLFTFGTPTTVLYRSELIRQTPQFFDESTLHDDTDACYRVLRKWSFGFVHEVLSFSRVGNESVTSNVAEFGPDRLDELLQLSKFGPIYLEKSEFSDQEKRCKYSYYSFLARKLLTGSNARFWRYHKTGLRSGKLELEKARLFKHIALELIRVSMSPRLGATRLLHRLQEGIKSKSPQTQAPDRTPR